MPELPEVETIRRDLAEVVIGKKIKDITIRKAKMVRGPHRQLRTQLRGQRVTDIGRRGKLLMLQLSPSQKYLLLHLKMTGQLIYHDKKEIKAGGHPWPPIDLNPQKLSLPNKFTHVTITFTGGAKLYFNDQRQFGFLHLVTPEEKELITKTYGIEPLTAAFTFENFRDALKTRTTSIKSVLLNQAVIAGLGNIYVDEACFAARVRPARRAGTLTHDELTRLFRACTTIIRQAIKYRGTTFNHYRDSKGQRGNYVRFLKVYGRSGEACRRCGKTLKKIKMNGRGTTYCAGCQA